MGKDNGAEALSRRRKGWEPETEVGDDGGCAGSARSERFVTVPLSLGWAHEAVAVL